MKRVEHFRDIELCGTCAYWNCTATCVDCDIFDNYRCICNCNKEITLHEYTSEKCDFYKEVNNGKESV